MSLLIYSPRCAHSLDIIDYIQKNKTFKQMVKFHNINTQGIPQKYANSITRVPTLLTQNGKILVGNEIKAWLNLLTIKRFRWLWLWFRVWGIVNRR